MFERKIMSPSPLLKMRLNSYELWGPDCLDGPYNHAYRNHVQVHVSFNQGLSQVFIGGGHAGAILINQLKFFSKILKSK